VTLLLTGSGGVTSLSRSGCSRNQGSRAGSYNLVVTANSGSLTETTGITLTVQQRPGTDRERNFTVRGEIANRAVRAEKMALKNRLES
jgi:hypothetical protein